MPQGVIQQANNGSSVDSTYILAIGATQLVVPIIPGLVLQGIYCPSNLTATSVTLVEASPNNGNTWFSVYSSGDIGTGTPANAFGFYVAASRLVRLGPADFYGCNLIRFTFNTAQLTSAASFILAVGQVTGV